MRVYEELFIMKPDAPEEEVDGFIDQIKQVITSGNGTVDKVDKWGVRKLAYRVSKYHEGLVRAGGVFEHAGAGSRSGAADARDRLGDQVHHGAHRRKAEENREAEEVAR